MILLFLTRKHYISSQRPGTSRKQDVRSRSKSRCEFRS